VSASARTEARSCSPGAASSSRPGRSSMRGGVSPIHAASLGASAMKSAPICSGVSTPMRTSLGWPSSRSAAKRISTEAPSKPGAFDQVEGRTYLEADYEVTATDGSSRSFTAHVGGRMNNDGTMRAILYGFVSEGWLRGAQVVDRFVGTGAGCVKGSLTIAPRWAPVHGGGDD